MRVIDGEHKRKTGAIVGVNDPEMPSVFTIEFGDGSDAEVPVALLERLPDFQCRAGKPERKPPFSGTVRIGDHRPRT